MIAGLEDISSGELYIDGKLVNDVEPKDRDIAMVFQNYALYPHMSVYDNMAFGLKLRKTPKDEIDKKVHDAAKILDLEHLLDLSLIHIYAPASYTDSAGQLSMVEDSISAGVDAICIASCDSTAIVPALEKATAAGIPVVVFNTLVPDFKDNITFVGVDNYDASYRVTEELIKAHDGKGNLVILEGDPAGYQNIERTRAVDVYKRQGISFSL